MDWKKIGLDLVAKIKAMKAEDSGWKVAKESVFYIVQESIDMYVD